MGEEGRGELSEMLPAPGGGVNALSVIAGDIGKYRRRRKGEIFSIVVWLVLEERS